jgi:hypothetical protein
MDRGEDPVRDPGPLSHLDPLAGLGGRPGGVLHDQKKEPGKDTPKGGSQETAKARPKPTEADSARATKKPTAAQIKEIDAHIARANKHLNMSEVEAGSKEAQRAVDLVVKYYGIDTSNASRTVYTWGDATKGGHTEKDRSVHIHSPALIDAPSLAGTVVHEVTHANQIKLHGWYADGPKDTHVQNYYAREAMGYQAALSNADTLGLTDKKKEWYAKEVETAKGMLTKENLKLLESGQYWGMKAGNPGD